MDHNQPAEGRASVTTSVCSSTAVAVSTTSICALMPLVHSVLTALMDHAAVCAVKGSPLEKETSRRWKV